MSCTTIPPIPKARQWLVFVTIGKIATNTTNILGSASDLPLSLTLYCTEPTPTHSTMEKTTITRKDLIAYLLSGEAVKGITFISASWETTPKINKFVSGRGSAPNPFFDKVRKRTTGAIGLLASDKLSSAY